MNEEVARFEELCDALRRNDPDTTEIGYQHHTRGNGRRLGEALQGNRYVSTIFLCLNDLLDINEEGTESVSLLLRYIRESEAMRKIALRNGLYDGLYASDEVIATLAPLFLQAIAENPRIEDLTLDNKLSSDNFALLLRTTQSLKKLSILFIANWTAAEPELVADAFGANRTVECLRLLNISNANIRMVESVLRQLGSHPCLRELALHHCGQTVSVSTMNALAHLLQSTTSLEHLELDGLWLDEEGMECLFEGLHSNQSITKLSLRCCYFDLEATDVLFSCMRSGETGSCIRELSLDMNIFADSDAGTMMASSLIMPDENQGTGSSIGSSLEILTLRCDIPGFYDALAANASRIRLPCLHLHLHRPYRAGEKEWEALCRCLPQLVYQRDITFPQTSPNASSLNFVDAMRKNGSMQRYEYDDDDDTFFNVREMRLIQSFCERNGAIPILVAKVRADSDSNDGEEDKTDLSLLPTIFEAAKQAPRTGPNSMFIALLNAGDSIGPRCGVKRARQHALP